jgi:hypothetical protein
MGGGGRVTALKTVGEVREDRVVGMEGSSTPFVIEHLTWAQSLGKGMTPLPLLGPIPFSRTTDDTDNGGPPPKLATRE